MTWVRLADDFADHPKVIAAGPLAGWLWVCSLAYANKYLTDGFVPQGAVRRLADVDDPARLAARLVEVGLWTRADGGYRIHDYADFQPSAETVRAERERTAERVRTWRERQKSGRDNGVSNGVTYAVSTGSPVPVPVPSFNPAPAGTSPLPPPLAEGELAPTTEGDQVLWLRAFGQITDGMLPANVEKVAALEPLGRGPDGGLRLRAPPWADAGRFQGAVRAALVNAGDADGGKATIVTG